MTFDLLLSSSDGSVFVIFSEDGCKGRAVYCICLKHFALVLGCGRVCFFFFVGKQGLSSFFGSCVFRLTRHYLMQPHFVLFKAFFNKSPGVAWPRPRLNTLFIQDKTASESKECYHRRASLSISVEPDTRKAGHGQWTFQYMQGRGIRAIDGVYPVLFSVEIGWCLNTAISQSALLSRDRQALKTKKIQNMTHCPTTYSKLCRFPTSSNSNQTLIPCRAA